MIVQIARAVLLACWLFVAMEMPGAVPGSRLAEPVKTPWRSTQRTEGQTHWQSVTTYSNVVTRKLTFHTNSFVELGAGLNVPNAQGQFIASDPSFTLTKTGAEARSAAHHVFVPSDIGGGDGIKVVTPKGDELVFQPLLVDYYDPVDGRSILLDSVTNATGWLTASNEIVFSNCFTRLKASIRLRNTKAGLESDLILHERPPDPESLGLSSSARLEMLTEQVSGAAPTRRESIIRREQDPAKKAAMVEPDFTDSELSFNGLKMIAGTAFATPATTNSAAGPARPSRVGKSFLLIDNRRILIEAVEHRQARGALLRLPLSTNALPLKAGLPSTWPVGRLAKTFRHLSPLVGRGESREAALRKTPAKPIQQAMSAARATETGSALLASTASAEPAFILDYLLVSEYGVNTDFTFRGDTTYWVSSYDMFGGTTTVEGGTVIKFSPAAGIFVYEGNPLVFDTTNHLPAIFTCLNDDSVGEILPGSTGTPSQIEANGFYFAGTTTRQFENVRFTHLSWPIVMEEGAVALRHVQMRDVAYGVYVGPATVSIYNGLFVDCAYVYGGGATAFTGQHLTVHDAVCLGQPDDPASSTATIKNSLLVEVQYPPSSPPSGPVTYPEISTSYTQVASASLSSDDGVFQTMEGGEHYLLAPTFRNIGSTDIDEQLKAVLTNLTTFAPALLTGSLNQNTNLIPRAIRDTNGLDLGYHYPVVDYATKGWIIENATVTVSGGVVLAAAPSPNGASLWLSPGKLVSIGTPTRLNQFLRLSQVQETNLARVPNMLSYGYGEGPSYPELRLRFTEFSSLSGEQYLLYLGSGGRRLEACHSSFFNGDLGIYMYDGMEQVIGLTNNVFRSVTAQFGGNSPSYFYCYNNLFKEGIYSMYGGNTNWIIKDNVFHHGAVSDDASAVVAGHNAYVAMTNQLSFEATSVTLTNLSYASGALGRYYLSDTNLQNVGSRTAAAAGLWHFTTTTNQVRETNSTVDIGFHYLALAAGQPVDTDGDRLADYLEDPNGNGAADTGETGFTNPDSDYDGRGDGQEITDGTDPLSAVSVLSTRLAYFPFNDTNYAGTDGQVPLAKTNLANVDAWLSKGVQVSSTGAAFLKYREVETNATANLNLRNGAVRFWFKSSWDTGTGTSNQARLLEVGTKGSTTTNGWWALYFSKTNGTEISFAAETNNAGATYLTATSSWMHCDWNQLVLNYTPSNSALYLNSSLVATGLGVTLWPAASVRASGFTVGSDASGTNQAKGLFEDLETFNYPLPTNAIAENFQTNRPPNAIADLKMWLKADSSAIETNGNPVRIRTWSDETCNGDGAEQVIEVTKQPYFLTNVINGLPAVHFYRSNFLSLPRFPTNWLQAEVFVVLKAENAKPTTACHLWTLGDGQNAYYPTTDGNIQDYFGRKNSQADVGVPAVNISAPHIYNVSSRTNEWSCRLNGVLHYSSLDNTNNGFNAGRRTLGANTGNPDSFDGYFAEILVFERVLTSGERFRVMTYLNQRYNLYPNPPAAPTVLLVQSVSPTQTDLIWETMLTTTNTCFAVERKTNNGAFVEVARLDNTKSYLDTGLQTNLAYSYRVKAINYAGESSYSPTATATTLVSGASLPMTDLKVWLKADAGWGGGPLAFWEDQSGNGHHAVQPLFHSRPQVEESYQVDGVTRQLLAFHQTNVLELLYLSARATTLFSNAAEGFMILKLTNLFGLGRPHWGFGNNTYYPLINTLDPNNNKIFDGFFRNGAATEVPTASLSGLHLYHATSTTTGWTNRINGALLYPTTVVSNSPTFSMATPIHFALGGASGQGTGTNRLHGRMGEFLLFNRALTTGERQTVENYLNHRFAIW